MVCPKSRSRLLKSEALEQLRSMIVNGQLTGGMALVEEDLASQFRMSRTPVREALRNLESEGYVVIVPQRGAYVPRLTREDVIEVFEIREALEPLAAAKACLSMPDSVIDEFQAKLDAAEGPPEDLQAIVRAGHQLHDLLMEYAGNRRMVDIISRYSGQIRRVQAFTEGIGAGRASRHEHRQMLDVLRKRDPGIVEAFMRFHLRSTRQLAIQALEEHARE